MTDRRKDDLGSSESAERRQNPPRRRELSRALGEAVVQIEEERTERQRLEDLNHTLEIERYTDSLTGLANARAFSEKLPELVAIAKNNNEPLALLFVDGDGLHDLNRTSGKAAGDMLIKKIAEGLQKTARDTDLVARIGGDEFAVALTGFKPLPEVSEHELINDTIARYKENLGHSATAGIAVLEQGDDADSLLARADAACTASKPESSRSAA